MDINVTFDMIKDMADYIIGSAQDNDMSITEYIYSLNKEIPKITEYYNDKVASEFSDLYDICYENECIARNKEPELFKTRYLLSEKYISSMNIQLPYSNCILKMNVYANVLKIIHKMASFDDLNEDYIPILLNIEDLLVFEAKKKELYKHKLFNKQLKVKLLLNATEQFKFYISFIFGCGVEQIAKNSFKYCDQNKLITVRFKTI